MSIPKKIHYCWFSGEKKPPFIRRCIRSWKRRMPDYELVCWDSGSFDFASVPFVKQAYERRKWAFVADYIRLYALYTQGGIYLDTDVEVYKSFDEFLQYPMFTGTDITSDGVIGMEAAIMGSEAGNPALKECMKYYEGRNYVLADGTNDMTTLVPFVMAGIYKKYGYEAADREQTLSDGTRILSTEYFCNIVTSQYRRKNYAFHRNVSAWCFDHRGKVYKWCYLNGFMPLYKAVERVFVLFRKKRS